MSAAIRSTEGPKASFRKAAPWQVYRHGCGFSFHIQDAVRTLKKGTTNTAMGTNAQAMITATVIYPAAKGCFNDGFQGRIGMKRILLAIVFFMCCVLCLAGPATQPVKPDYSLGDVFEYDGDLGGKLSIGMTLRISDDAKTATGCYFYYKYCKDIRVDGTIDGRKIVMHEYDGNGHETGRFVGEFPAVDPPSFSNGQ